mgnify:FL=1
MSSSGIKKLRTSQDRVTDVLREQEQEFIQNLKPGGSEKGGFGLVGLGDTGLGSPRPAGNYLATTGDTMMGPIAYNPTTVSIGSNEIDIGLSSDKSSTYVILDSATTDLITITGAQFSGQDLILQGKTGSTITVKNSGNIVTSDGADYDIVGLALVRLIYDEASTKWRIYSTVGSGGGGGSTWVGTAASQLNMGAFSIVGAWGGAATTLGIESTIDMNNFNIEDLNVLKINSGSAGTADSFTMFGTSTAGALNLVDDNDFFDFQVDGDSKFRMYDDRIEINEPLRTLTANTPDIGQSTFPFGTVYAQGFNTLGTLTVATTSLQLGDISTDGKVKGFSGVIGLQCTDDAITKGTAGTVQIPDQYNNSEPTTSDLDGWFGNKSGCIGIMRTATQSRLYARDSTVWKYEILS